MRSWIPPFSRFVLAIVGFSVATGVAAGEFRYAIVEFLGKSEIQHSNQALFGGDARSLPSTANSPQHVSSTSEAHYFLVADRQSKELYLYSKTPLWRLDTGGLDEGVEMLWHQTPDELLIVNQIGSDIGSYFRIGEAMTKARREMWSAMTNAILVDLIRFSIGDPIGEQATQIHKQCVHLEFGESENIASGGKLVQRMVQADGNRIVINNSDSGQLVSAMTAERHQEKGNEFGCRAIVYLSGRPIESLSGLLTVRLSGEIPESISKLLQRSKNTPAKEDHRSDVGSGTQTIAAKQPSSQYDAKEGIEGQFRWSYVVLVIGCLTIFSVVAVLMFHAFRGDKS